MWNAVSYFNRNRLYLNRVMGNFNLYHTSLCVDGVGLVEDKVAYAVVDGLTLVVFYRLQSVSMVSNDDISTCVYDGMCLASLTDGWLQLVLYTPVWTYDNIC